MSGEATVALAITLSLLFVLMALGVSLAWVMMLAGIVGLSVLVGFDKGLVVLGQQSWSIAKTESLVCLPLFILMGEIAFKSGLTSDLIAWVSSFVGRLRGGLGMAISIACGIFGAVSGSVVAALAAFGRIAIPELSKYHYKKNFSAAILACSGTFASMIPPSLALIVYGWLTETSIGRLFIGALIPGIITIVVYCLFIYVMVSRNPSLAPERPPRFNWSQRGRLTLVNMPIIFVALIVLGGLYLGWFTATESAAIGFSLVLILAIALKRIGLKGIANAFLGAGRTAAMLSFLLIGAQVLSVLVVITRVTDFSLTLITGLGLSPYLLILFLYILYLVMGCFLAPIVMIILTVPILLPLVEFAGFNAIWFGIFTTKTLEIASVTPPVGLNVYIIEGLAQDKDVRSEEIFKISFWFVVADTLIIALLTAFPQICLWLPSKM